MDSSSLYINIDLCFIVQNWSCPQLSFSRCTTLGVNFNWPRNHHADTSWSILTGLGTCMMFTAWYCNWQLTYVENSAILFCTDIVDKHIPHKKSMKHFSLPSVNICTTWETIKKRNWQTISSSQIVGFHRCI